jgi:hypothetical protein
LVSLEIVLIFTQYRGIVCAERTSLRNVLDAPDATCSDVLHVESHFGLFGHGVCVGAR